MGIVSITRAATLEQLRQAKNAGFNHVEIYLPQGTFAKQTAEEYAGEVKQRLKKTGLNAVSVVVSKSSPSDFEGNLLNSIEFASALGVKRVVADYPKSRSEELKILGIGERERAKSKVRFLHEAMLSPFEAGEILSKAKPFAEKKGVSIFIEAPGGSDLTAKALSFRGWQKITKQSHGFVLDLEHFAQQRIVQPLEEVHSPLQRFLENVESGMRESKALGEEDGVLLKSFYGDYSKFMTSKHRKFFSSFLQNPSRDKAKEILRLVKPSRVNLPPSGKPEEMLIVPSNWVSKLMMKAWSSLPIEHVHLTGGHLAPLLRNPKQTIFGPSDERLEHSYEIRLKDEKTGVWKSVFLGSTPEHKLYGYLHIPLPGNLYAAEGGKWHLLLKALLKARSPVLNFEIPPESLSKEKWDGVRRVLKGV